MSIKHVTSRSEFDEVVKANKVVVIDFYADWCGPCKMIAPVYEKIAAKFPDGVFLKVNAEELEDVSAEYEISAMPTFVFLKEGKEVTRMAGADPGKLMNLVKAQF